MKFIKLAIYSSVKSFPYNYLNVPYNTKKEAFSLVQNYSELLSSIGSKLFAFNLCDVPNLSEISGKDRYDHYLGVPEMAEDLENLVQYYMSNKIYTNETARKFMEFAHKTLLADNGIMIDKKESWVALESTKNYGEWSMAHGLSDDDNDRYIIRPENSSEKSFRFSLLHKNDIVLNRAMQQIWPEKIRRRR